MNIELTEVDLVKIRQAMKSRDEYLEPGRSGDSLKTLNARHHRYVTHMHMVLNMMGFRISDAEIREDRKQAV